jgi:hypothetical protein
MRTVQGSEKLGYQNSQVGQPVCPPVQDENGHLQRSGILLVNQIPVDRNEHVEVLRCQGEQFAVPDGRPTHLLGGPDLMA